MNAVTSVQGCIRVALIPLKCSGCYNWVSLNTRISSRKASILPTWCAHVWIRPNSHTIKSSFLKQHLQVLLCHGNYMFSVKQKQILSINLVKVELQIIKD